MLTAGNRATMFETGPSVTRTHTKQRISAASGVCTRRQPWASSLHRPIAVCARTQNLARSAWPSATTSASPSWRCWPLALVQSERFG